MDKKNDVVQPAAEAPKKPLIQRVERFIGMHNGSVKGKGFEASRRNRKSHAERRSEIASRAKTRR